MLKIQSRKISTDTIAILALSLSLCRNHINDMGSAIKKYFFSTTTHFWPQTNVISLSWAPCIWGQLYSVQPTVNATERKQNGMYQKGEIDKNKLERWFSMSTGCTVEKSIISVACIRTVKTNSQNTNYIVHHIVRVSKAKNQICKHSHNFCARFSLAKCFSYIFFSGLCSTWDSYANTFKLCWEI